VCYPDDSYRWVSRIEITGKMAVALLRETVPNFRDLTYISNNPDQYFPNKLAVIVNVDRLVTPDISHDLAASLPFTVVYSHDARFYLGELVLK
jgi:hypothetical protein